MRAILVDAKNLTVSEVDHSGELQDMYTTIGCELVEVVKIDDNHHLWIDESGGVNGTRVGFMWGEYPLFGNALIFSFDEEGEVCPATIAVEVIKKNITFWASDSTALADVIQLASKQRAMAPASAEEAPPTPDVGVVVEFTLVYHDPRGGWRDAESFPNLAEAMGSGQSFTKQSCEWYVEKCTREIAHRHVKLTKQATK